PDYEALSHVWGPPQDTTLAYVNPLVPSFNQSSFNLATALRHLRLQKRSRMLWIDTICMNQQDIEERSPLVRHMGQIYRLSLRVIVWFG
ncbi:hypothetical protein CERZMDRAFT_8719, partial [Cercospora zeae-maydis SCOH1-5]